MVTQNRIWKYAKLFGLLVKTDLVILRQFIIGQLINIVIWSSSVVIIATYIFPKLGMTEKFGAFMVVTSIVAHSFWGIWDSSYKLVEDIEGRQNIGYKLTLPLPSWLIMVQYAVQHAINKLIPSIIVLPLFKLILRSRMDLSQFSLFKFILIFVTGGIFTGFFFVFVSSFVPTSHKVDNVGVRLLFPMYFFGATNYAWSILYCINSTLAYLTLLNPLVFVMEGIHAAVLGGTHYIPFYICLLVLWSAIIVFGFIGVVKYKKRLDFV